MASRDEILAYANGLLELDSFSDYGPMGLQVVGAAQVAKLACGVSASRELFERAASARAQLLLVHHGILWDNESRVIGPVQRGRLEALFAADLTLAAYHLALDAHPELGNNALLAERLGVEAKQRFASLGWGGRLASPVSIQELAGRVQQLAGRQPLIFPSGPESVARVAICSGGAASLLHEAIRDGYDCYLTGEAAEPSERIAQEAGIHFVAAGHYATETLGVQALARRLAERFDLEWEFIDLPTPV